MCGEDLKELQPRIHTNRKAWRNLCYGYGVFCKVRDFHTGRLSQYTAASQDPI